MSRGCVSVSLVIFVYGAGDWYVRGYSVEDLEFGGLRPGWGYGGKRPYKFGRKADGGFTINFCTGWSLYVIGM
jgi:hypothetical protein